MTNSSVASVAIVGGGSMGLLLAARLSASGCETTVWTRSEEQALLLEREGIALLEGPGSAAVRVPVRAAPIDQVPPTQGDTLVLIALKQTGITDSLLKQLDSTLGRNSTMISFCNGVGHLERIAEAVPGRPQLAAITTEGALRTSPAEVKHTGRGQTWIGQAPLFAGSSKEYAQMPTEDRIRGIENLFQTAGFSISVSNNMTERILRKLLINSVINPLTALLRIRNGELLETADRLELMKTLFEETVSILKASGLSDSQGLWEELADVCARTSRNESSMLQDVRNGRLTEIEAINGAVSLMAAGLGIQAPWNEMLTAMVRSISKA